jgi:hypothetical protein
MIHGEGGGLRHIAQAPSQRQRLPPNRRELLLCRLDGTGLGGVAMPAVGQLHMNTVLRRDRGRVRQ